MRQTLSFFFLLYSIFSFSQAGLSISPGKMYFRNEAGTVATQKVRIANPNDKAVEVGVSLGDWNYDEKGSNHIGEMNTLSNSAAAWVQVLPNSYFVIEPNEIKEVDLILNVPSNLAPDVPVHTAMVFFTQLNPGNAVDENGAAIKVTVRMGLKVYHALPNNTEAVDIVNIEPSKTEEGHRAIDVSFENTGRLWSDGKITATIFDQQTGAKHPLNTLDFYSLPQDSRKQSFALPQNLAAGTYTFIVQLTYGKDNTVKIAELEFSL
ncbi:hypothetical protein [Myroides sp. DW712]|uniref:hypothetical protein n=1 Tax=Myroides sp. DW712 TaxID=3389800 RepID=UPI00397C26F5